MSNTFELGILRRSLAERCTRRDAIDIEGVAGMLRVRDGIVDQCLFVLHALGLSEPDHSVGIVLLRAWIRICKECVDAIDACELHAGIARFGVAAAGETEFLPALCYCGKIGLRNALGDRSL